MAAPLVLRPLEPGDETAARAAHKELAPEGFDFLLDLRDAEPWPAYLARLESLRTASDGQDGWVPATFLVAEVAGEIVGRTSVRHRLNPWLARWGGHIGYGVRPAFRRRGHATEILRQSLVIARAAGLARALLTCEDDNMASAAVIERCGGMLEAILPAEKGSQPMRRYWIELVPPGHRRPNSSG